ncbi:Spy0128 family protein [Bifidobacterium canis]|uniref:Spy0128 family protein n=1 Tax=Bifidobacterium canis TaxID=2610880 RepID=UPI0018C26BFD
MWEASGKDHLIKYDSHKVTVTVTITDDGSGQLAISSYQVSGSTTFTNYVYRPATLPKTGLPTYWGLITAVIVALMFALAAAVWSVRGGRKGAR